MEKCRCFLVFIEKLSPRFGISCRAQSAGTPCAVVVSSQRVLCMRKERSANLVFSEEA